MNLPTDCWKNSTQIPGVPVNVTVQTLFTLIVKSIVRKKAKSQHSDTQISLAVHSVNVPVHPTTTPAVRTSAVGNTKFTLQEQETDLDVTFASVDA